MVLGTISQCWRNLIQARSQSLKAKRQSLAQLQTAKASAQPTLISQISFFESFVEPAFNQLISQHYKELKKLQAAPPIKITKAIVDKTALKISGQSIAMPKRQRAYSLDLQLSSDLFLPLTKPASI